VTGCLLIGGPSLSIFTSRGEVLFEDHVYCGPMPVTKTGLGRALPEAHPFWAAVTTWYATGKHLDGNRCRVETQERK